MPLITKPTRVAEATLIDHIYTNNFKSIIKSGIIITDVADHFGTFHLVKNKTAAPHKMPFKKRIITEAKLTIFKQYLDQTDFTSIYSIECPDMAYNVFIDYYKQCYDKAFPFIDIKPNKTIVKREPWMTAGLMTSMQNKIKTAFQETSETIKL